MASDHRVSATKVVKYIKADTHVHYGYKALQQAILKELKDSDVRGGKSVLDRIEDDVVREARRFLNRQTEQEPNKRVPIIDILSAIERSRIPSKIRDAVGGVMAEDDFDDNVDEALDRALKACEHRAEQSAKQCEKPAPHPATAVEATAATAATAAVAAATVANGAASSEAAPKPEAKPNARRSAAEAAAAEMQEFLLSSLKPSASASATKKLASAAAATTKPDGSVAVSGTGGSVSNTPGLAAAAAAEKPAMPTPVAVLPRADKASGNKDGSTPATMCDSSMHGLSSTATTPAVRAVAKAVPNAGADRAPGASVFDSSSSSNDDDISDVSSVNTSDISMSESESEGGAAVPIKRKVLTKTKTKPKATTKAEAKSAKKPAAAAAAVAAATAPKSAKSPARTAAKSSAKTPAKSDAKRPAVNARPIRASTSEYSRSRMSIASRERGERGLPSDPAPSGPGASAKSAVPETADTAAVTVKAPAVKAPAVVVKPDSQSRRRKRNQSQSDIAVTDELVEVGPSGKKAKVGNSMIEADGSRHEFVQADSSNVVKGALVQVMDAGLWYAAKIKRVDLEGPRGSRIEIHFEGWAKTFDKWMYLSQNMVRRLITE